MAKDTNVDGKMTGKHVPATESINGAGFKFVEEKRYDVAMAYALLSDGTMPPVIRGEDLEG